MCRELAGLIVLGIFVAGCGQPTATPTTPIVEANGKVPATSGGATSGPFALEDFVVGEPVRFANLTVFSVASREPKNDDRFITLDEGLKTGTVEIRELAAATEQSTQSTNNGRTEPAAANPFGGDVGANDVNSLIVVNHSDKPLYLMPGEVIIGGSQDRTIGNELVIAADSQPTTVPVFCVEHGRWGAKGIEDTLVQLNNAGASQVLRSSVSLSVSPDQTLNQVAQQADDGKFVASVGQLGKSARLAVQSDKNQSAVWEKVADTNAKSGVQPVSGAFTACYSDAETLKRLEPYLESLQAPVATNDRVVGVLVAINGKIESIDLFESTPLFRKVWPKLLKSYALDAVNATGDATQKPAECTRATALSFFAETLHASVASSNTQRGIALVKRDGQHVLSFTSHLESPAKDAAMGGMGGGVHVSGYAI